MAQCGRRKDIPNITIDVTNHPQVVVMQGLHGFTTLYSSYSKHTKKHDQITSEALGAQLGANENCNPRDSIATVRRKCLGDFRITHFYRLKWRLVHGLTGDFLANEIKIPVSLQWFTSSGSPVLATFTLAYGCTGTRVVQLLRFISFLLHFALALASIFAIAHRNAITSGAL